MKRVISILIFILFLTGCGDNSSDLNQILSLRQDIVSAKGCSFSVEIIADYQTNCYVFRMDCASDDSGNLNFTVTAPDTISGITGSISQEGGKLTFDDRYLVFAPLADGQITPVSAPWLFLKALRTGYISGCTDEESMTVMFQDTYQNDPLDISVTFTADKHPQNVEIFWQGRRVVTMTVENFVIL